MRRRYEELLTVCRLIHSGVSEAVKSLFDSNPTVKEIRQSIWKTVGEAIRELPFGIQVLDGRAFCRIGDIKLSKLGKPTVELHNPKSWTPRQLSGKATLAGTRRL
jgi:hypothetical protein